eukprot:m.162894 g.162894  ORF g.162894 m.162894 type:complete len:74 (+) comp16544_c1_seq3:149-370(+)
MDWYRFGLLTSRLHRYEDAHKCFHHCLTECQSRSSLRLKTLVHLLSINTQVQAASFPLDLHGNWLTFPCLLAA